MKIQFPQISRQRLMMTITLVVAFLFTSSAAFASLTFSSNAITGDATSTIDVGAGNTLNLQTTNNGPITTGGNLLVGANLGVGTSVGSGSFLGLTITAPSIVDKTITTVGAARNAAHWAALTLNPSAPGGASASYGGLFGIFVPSTNSVSLASSPIRAIQNEIWYEGTGAGPSEVTAAQNQVFAVSASGGNITNAFGARNKVFVQGANVITSAIGTQSVVEIDPGSSGTSITNAYVGYNTFVRSGGGQAGNVFLSYVDTSGAGGSNAIYGFYCGALQATTGGTYCFYNNSSFPVHSEGPFQTNNGTEISDIADGILTVTMDNGTTGVSLDVSTANTFKFRNLANSSDAPVTMGSITASGMINFSSSTTPTSDSDVCTTGTITWDTNYIYVCVSTNTWKRTLLTTGW